MERDWKRLRPQESTWFFFLNKLIKENKKQFNSEEIKILFLKNTNLSQSSFYNFTTWASAFDFIHKLGNREKRIYMLNIEKIKKVLNEISENNNQHIWWLNE